MSVYAENYDPLPDEPVGEVEPGEYHCQICGCRVTVNQQGTELGHALHDHNITSSNVEREVPCPRRDSSLNPTGSDGGASA